MSSERHYPSLIRSRFSLRYSTSTARGGHPCLITSPQPGASPLTAVLAATASRSHCCPTGALPCLTARIPTGDAALLPQRRGSMADQHHHRQPHPLLEVARSSTRSEAVSSGSLASPFSSDLGDLLFRCEDVLYRLGLALRSEGSPGASCHRVGHLVDGGPSWTVATKLGMVLRAPNRRQCRALLPDAQSERHTRCRPAPVPEAGGARSRPGPVWPVPWGRLPDRPASSR